jgi:hypothetical protein
VAFRLGFMLYAHSKKYSDCRTRCQNSEGVVKYVASTGELAKLKAQLKDNPELVSSKDNSGHAPLHLAVRTPPLAVTFHLTSVM